MSEEYILNYFKIENFPESITIIKLGFDRELSKGEMHYTIQTLRQSFQNKVFYKWGNDIYCVKDEELQNDFLNFDYSKLEEVGISQINIEEDEQINLMEENNMNIFLIGQMIATHLRRISFIVTYKGDVFIVVKPVRINSQRDIEVNPSIRYQIYFRDKSWYLVPDRNLRLREVISEDRLNNMIDNREILSGTKMYDLCNIKMCDERRKPYTRCEAGLKRNVISFHSRVKYSIDEIDIEDYYDEIRCPTQNLPINFDTDSVLFNATLNNKDMQYIYPFERISLVYDAERLDKKDRDVINEKIYIKFGERLGEIVDFIGEIKKISLEGGINIEIGKSLSFTSRSPKIIIFTQKSNTKNLFNNMVCSAQTVIPILLLGDNIDSDSIIDAFTNTLEINKYLGNENLNFEKIELADLDNFTNQAFIVVLEDGSKDLEFDKLKLKYHNQGLCFQKMTYSSFSKFKRRKNSKFKNYLKNNALQWNLMAGAKIKGHGSRIFVGWSIKRIDIKDQSYVRLMLSAYSDIGNHLGSMYRIIKLDYYKINGYELIKDFIDDIERTNKKSFRAENRLNTVILKQGRISEKMEEKLLNSFKEKSQFSIVQIISGSSRVFRKIQGDHIRPKIGTSINTEKGRYTMVTTALHDENRTQQPIDIHFLDKDNIVEMKKIIQQLYHLTRVDIGYISGTTKFPLPIKAVQDMNSFLREYVNGDYSSKMLYYR